MSNLTSKLKNKLDLYGKTGTKDKLGTKVPTYGKIKPIFCQIIPASLTGNTQRTVADTEYANVTHVMRCRKLSIKNLAIDMYFIDKDGLKYNILYFQPDYQDNQFWEIMLEIKYE
ncbi:head-tail adaptor protein [Clostridium autoethanogenum]|uniref:Head-tail adaptor protein n=1 Tax=Clostridium autoethanogenum TaxID=84023 RepID=A0A3M0SY90_9CLOT|nr:head-tail adaptor protein [Clostridium autoethanogenum]RMD02742.1 head-tail adaptor protein [Clostridium autoethanogenum]